jgi:hypothetical protein
MANRGMPAALIRPTAMPTPHETNGETSTELLEDPVDGDGQGRGEANGSARRSSKRRPKASAAGDKGKGRKLTLPDSVFDRLVLTAIKRGSTASAVAAEILDRNLPRLRIAADD